MRKQHPRTGHRSRLFRTLWVAIGIGLLIGLPFAIAAMLVREYPSCVATPTLDVELGDEIYVIPRSWEIVRADGKDIPYSAWIGDRKRPCFRAGDRPLQPYSIVFDERYRIRYGRSSDWPEGLGFIRIASVTYSESTHVPLGFPRRWQRPAPDPVHGRVREICREEALWSHCRSEYFALGRGLLYQYDVAFRQDGAVGDAREKAWGRRLARPDQSFFDYDQRVRKLIWSYLSTRKLH